jgi:general secretion pathway protein L
LAALNFMGRWLDLLASTILEWWQVWRGRRTIIVTRENNRLALRESGEADVLVAEVPFGEKAPDEVVRATGGGIVELLLSPERALMRRLNVPKQARDFLSGIVLNQIERLSPWKPDQACYGFSAEPDPTDADALNVRILIASRSSIEAVRQEAQDAGIAIDRIVGRESRNEALAPILLWSRAGDAPHSAMRHIRLAVLGALLALVAGTVGTVAWAVASSSSAIDEAEQISARAKTIQRQGIGASASAASGIAERAWRWKQASPSAVILIEALSKALPDTAFLTELNLQGSTLRIIGQTTDAPALIGPLEQSGHLTDVRFFAPTTRAADGNLFRFHLEARVQPRLEVAAR